MTTSEHTTELSGKMVIAESEIQAAILAQMAQASVSLRRAKQIRTSALVVASEEMARAFPDSKAEVAWLLARSGRLSSE